jgi:hypothetical protein
MEHPEIMLPVVIPEEISPQEPIRLPGRHNSFIEANTIPGSLEEIKHQHIIPVFSNNEPLISHADFIEASSQLTADIFNGEHILKPDIRVSHPVMGRIPDAKDKPVHLLMEWEKTLYFQRMAFIIEIPSIQSEVDGNVLSLTIGGVRSFADENLRSRNVSDQHFKIFIGFKNTVCCNMCIWTDGYMSDVRVKSLGQLKAVIRTLLESYNQSYHLHHLSKLTEFSITEQQFANLIGRCRLYQHLPKKEQSSINPLLLSDSQLIVICKDYYRDRSFCRDENGNINLWKLYNLLTGSNKSSYIDSFLDRSANAYSFSEQLRFALEGRIESWYLN